MSALLAPQTKNTVTLRSELLVKNQVEQIKASPRRMAVQLFRQWSETFDALWSEKQGVTPAMRLAELGPLAGELIAASGALCQFMLQMIGDSDPDMKAAIESRLAILPARTVHQDGTVTLD